MILDAERPVPGDGDAAVRTVEQALMRLDHPVGQACRIHRKAVVHAGDLDHPVIGPPTHALHRMVGAAMTLAHFHRPRADRDAQHLVPKARSEAHTSELQSLMRTSYAAFCLKTKTK